MRRHLAEDLDYLFREKGDATRAEGMRRYMKDQFPYYGISSPVRRTILSEYFTLNNYPDSSGFPVILDELWSYDEREMQYAGLDLIRRLIKKQPLEFIEVLEDLIVRKSWWDTVDALSVDAGTLFQKYPALQISTTTHWMSSGNLWLKRAAVIHQLKYKEHTDWNLLQKYILQIADSTDFFLRKAAGWALRQYSKHNPQAVRNFIEKYRDKLSGLTIREGSKYV